MINGTSLSFNLHFAYDEDKHFSYIKAHLSLFFIKFLFFYAFFPLGLNIVFSKFKNVLHIYM